MYETSLETTEQIYRLIRDYYKTYGKFPTVATLAPFVGIKRTGIVFHLKKLVESKRITLEASTILSLQ